MILKISKYKFVNNVIINIFNSSKIQIFTSSQAGVGKSLSVRKMKDDLVKDLREQGKLSLKPMLITLPLHGPEVTADEVLQMLLKENSDLKSCIIHLDIPQRVSSYNHC